jgi:electron transport complex protein RnfB
VTEPYQKLAQYLDGLPAGYPPTDSGVELRILSHLFSVQEAELALYLTLIDESARVVAFRAHQPVELVTSILGEMARKGLISVNRRGARQPVYSINQFVVGFWEGQVNRLDSELVKLFEVYAPIYFQKGPWKEIPQIRTIPIHEAIPITSEVMPYENAEEILRSKTLIAVRNCVCRQEHQIAGNGCNSILEACLSFDGAARNTVESGKGRFIGLDEALSILEKAKKDGLVLQPANSKNPIYLCACCKCCCGVLTHIKNHPQPGSLVSNPYYATHDPELCISCGACLEVCPMDALTFDYNDNVVFNQLRCIGCGLCVTVCQIQAIKIVRKPVSNQPTVPKNTLDTYLKIAFKRKSWKVIDVVSLVIRSFVDRLIAPR